MKELEILILTFTYLFCLISGIYRSRIYLSENDRFIFTLMSFIPVVNALVIFDWIYEVGCSYKDKK